MPDGYPEVTDVIVDLEEIDGKTHMKLTHVGVPAGSSGAGGWAQARQTRQLGRNRLRSTAKQV